MIKKRFKVAALTLALAAQFLVPVMGPSAAPVYASEASTQTGITYSYDTKNDWNSGYQGEIVMTNNSQTSYNGWTMTFETASTVTSLWGGEMVSQKGNVVTVKNPSWDSNFAAGSKVTIGFVANGSSKPSNFKFENQEISNGDNSQAGNDNQGNDNQGTTTTPGTNDVQDQTVNTTTMMQCENMTLSGTYAGKLTSPFNGVALYANNDKASYIQQFGYGSHDFTLCGASNNGQTARVDLVIGGETKGSFYFTGTTAKEYTLKNVSHKTGNQTIELVVTTDNGQWDAYIDYFKIDAAGASTNNNGTTGNNNGNQGNTGNQGTTGNQGNTGNQGTVVLDKNTKMIALTFDDGPSSTTTQVLDILEKYNVVATFFLIGQQINQNTVPIMQRQISMGCELANHSYTHQNMSGMSAYQVQQEISKTNDAIKNAVNVTPKFFRAPYLGTSNTMFSNINLAFIQGITNANDWEASSSAANRANQVLSNASDGTIVLLHDFQGNSATVQALPTIIEGLQKQGYTFVTLSQLFEAKGINPNQTGKIWTNVYR